MKETNLIKQLARLESVNDQMMAEIQYVDVLMRKVGFSEGIATVKATAHELKKQMEEEEG